jgi:PKD repeat protein
MVKRRSGLVLALVPALALAPACNDDDNPARSAADPLDPSLAVTCSASPTSGRAPLEVAFTAGPSGGSTVQWSFGDGSGESVGDTTHVYSDGGTFTPTVTIKGSGRQGSCRQTIVVQPPPPPPTPTREPNRPPEPDTRFDPGPTGSAPFRVIFNACPTKDPDGDRLTFRIDFGDRTGEATVCRPVHTYGAKGNYRATVCVSDGRFETCQTYAITVT